MDDTVAVVRKALAPVFLLSDQELGLEFSSAAILDALIAPAPEGAVLAERNWVRRVLRTLEPDVFLELPATFRTEILSAGKRRGVHFCH